MRPTAVIAAFAAMFAVSGAARAAEFDDFQAMCVKTNADPKTVLAMADASGWMPVPDQLMASLRRKDSPFANAEGRLRTGAKGMQVLLAGVGAGPLNDSSLKFSICAMGFAPAAPDLAKQTADWAAVPTDPRLTRGDTQAYLFSNGPSGHKPVALKDDQLSSLIAAHAAVAFIETSPNITMVGYGLPTP